MISYQYRYIYHFDIRIATARCNLHASHTFKLDWCWINMMNCYWQYALTRTVDWVSNILQSWRLERNKLLWSFVFYRNVVVLRLNLRAEIRVKSSSYDYKCMTHRTNCCTRIIIQVVLMWRHCSVGSKHMPSWTHEIDCTFIKCCLTSSSTCSHNGRPCVPSTQKFYAAASLMMRQALLIAAVRLIMNNNFGLYGSRKS